MKEILLIIWLTFLGIGHADDSTCPCSVDSHRILTCDPGTISRFPQDILEPCSNIRPQEILVVELPHQPLSQLENEAFSEFPNLLGIILSFNNIAFIAQDAFSGLSKLDYLFLSGNNITEFAEGTFDDLVSLKLINVAGNDYLDPTYVTNAWHMCHRVETRLEVQGNLFIFKDFEMSQSTDSYCDHLMNIQEYSGMCRTNGSTVDCRGLDRIGDSICFLKDWAQGPANYFTNILFEFPVDPVPTEVEDFFEGESNTFFKDFNSFQDSTESELAMNQIVKNLTFYATKFDLAKLPELTSRKTKSVTIWADTIFISDPITISYETFIRARKVSIDQKITMNITKEELWDRNQDVEIWAMKEDYTTINNVTMRQRKFGLLEILDEVSNTLIISDEKCNILPKDAIKDEVDVSNWFDFTHLNLMYVCAHTIRDSGNNARLVSQIANFTLETTFNSTLVNNQRIYNTARKFKNLAGKNGNIVPSYDIDRIKELAGLMYTNMEAYRNTELAQEEQLYSVKGRVEDMQTQFDIVEAQQELYFSLEMIQLEAVWAATDNAWNFSFEHRNGIEDSIGTAMEAMMNQTFDMREKELIEMKNQAEFSVEHIQDVIDKYKKQIERFVDIAKASFTVQKDEFKKFHESEMKFNEEYELWEIAIADWQYQQTVKAMFSFFSAIINIFSGEVPSLDDITDLADLINDLQDVWLMMEDIREMFDDMNLEDIENMSINPSTDFITALNRAVDMKMKGPIFDNIEATARIKLDDMNAAVEHDIDHTVDVMMALQSIADLGNRMIGEVGQFSDNMLTMAERYDELAIAQNDMERAVDEVESIKRQIEDFEVEKEEFYTKRDQAKKDYEDEINKMRDDYANITSEMREEYRKKITEKFDSFKATFSTLTDSYNNMMSILIERIQLKSYGLKQHSMNQRTMIMKLYNDFCDAAFFHSFRKCEYYDMPLMSDSFESLLEKLFNIQWDSITSDDEFPPDQRPEHWINFMDLNVMDDLEGLYYPIQIFKNESKLEVNIKDLDTENGLDQYWRIRIREMKIELYDERDQLIPSPGVCCSPGGAIQVRITHPSIFIDQSGDKEKHSFLGQHFFCSANYWTHPDVTSETCNVDSGFSASQYESTPNGIFRIEIKNPEDIRMQDLHKIKVYFKGSSIVWKNKQNVLIQKSF